MYFDWAAIGDFALDHATALIYVALVALVLLRVRSLPVPPETSDPTRQLRYDSNAPWQPSARDEEQPTQPHRKRIELDLD